MMSRTRKGENFEDNFIQNFITYDVDNKYFLTAFFASTASAIVTILFALTIKTSQTKNLSD